jgi:glutathione S-transferase/maleylpyruvate isomerase
MLTIYAIPVSLYCAKLRVLLRHKKLQWRELPPPGGYGSDEYKTIVPSGNLPALDDDRLLIADSEAIAEYLNEKFPEPPMLPCGLGERAKVREMSRFHDTRLEPELRKLFPTIDPAMRDSARVASQSAAISARLRQLASMLEATNTMAPDTLTLGDCGFPVTFTWIGLLEAELGLQIDWPDPVLAYRKRLASHSAVRDELTDYGPVLQTWLAGMTRA